MYNDLYGIIESRLADVVPSTVAVGPALAPEPPLPACQLYLADDKVIKADDPVTRRIDWGVKVVVGHNDNTGNANTEALDLLDAVRDGFDGWRPGGRSGLRSGFSVQFIKIAEFRDHGSIVYLVMLGIEVIPIAWGVADPVCGQEV